MKKVSLLVMGIVFFLTINVFADDFWIKDNAKAGDIEEQFITLIVLKKARRLVEEKNFFWESGKDLVVVAIGTTPIKINENKILLNEEDAQKVYASRAKPIRYRFKTK